MSPRYSKAHVNSFVLLKDNVNGARLAYRVQTQSRVLVYDFPFVVPPVPSSPPRAPQADVLNIEFCQSKPSVTPFLRP